MHIAQLKKEVDNIMKYGQHRTRLGQKAHQYLPNNERQRFCLKPVFNMYVAKQTINILAFST